MLRSYTSLNKYKRLRVHKYNSSNPSQITFKHNIRWINQSQTFRINQSSHSRISPFVSSLPTHTRPTSAFQYIAHRHFSLPEHEVVGLPALSPSVEQSKIVQWKKNEGDLVSADEAIASVQTDKAELDWQVTDDVYLAKILLQPGLEVPVGTPACIFVEEQSQVASFANYDSSSSSAPSPSSSSPTPSTPSPPTPAATDTSNLPEHRVEGMPALSPTAVDGAVVEWLVKEGDSIEEGSGIAEIQTDKSVVTWQSTDDQIVAKLLVPANADNKFPVGTPLAVFVDEKSDIDAFKNFTPGQSAPAPTTPAPAAETEAPKKEENTSQTPKAQAKSTTATTQDTGGRIFASPYAKKLASEMGISLDSVPTKSGNNGKRIVAMDVMSAQAKQKSKPTAASSSTSKPSASKTPPAVVLTGERTHEDLAVTTMREVIGQRLSSSKFSAPHFYVTMECNIGNLTNMRKEMNDGENNKISVNDFIIKACAMALRDVPQVNCGWIPNGTKDGKTVIRRWNYIDISVAVATPSGLITPIIKDADRKSLLQISLEIKDLARRAKDNKLLPDEFQGGTFTISNMGMFNVNNFTAIINPPQSAILAIGGAKQKLVPCDVNGYKAVSTMEVTMSSDHRSVDGALAAVWINAFQKYIENPSKLNLY